MMNKCRLSPVALGLALGVLWGVSILLLGLLTHYGFEGSFVASLRTMHGGSEFTLLDIFIAAFVGLVNGFIRGAILALLYNLFDCYCCGEKKSKRGK